jgi:hypothetical protein
MLKISGIPNNQNSWVCSCGKTEQQSGFYPVNGYAQAELPGRTSRWVACASCGRIIEVSTLRVVGAASGHRLTSKELIDIHVALQGGRLRNRSAERRTANVKRGIWRRIFLAVLDFTFWSLYCLLTIPFPKGRMRRRPRR